MTIGNAADSKLGLIFGLKKNPNDTISYFVVGIGTQVRDKGASEYYISYNDGVTADSVLQASNEEAILKGARKLWK